MDNSDKRLKNLEGELDVIKDKVIKEYKKKKASSTVRLSSMSAAENVRKYPEQNVRSKKNEKKPRKQTFNPTYIEQSRVVSEYKEEKKRQSISLSNIVKINGKGTKTMFKLGLVFLGISILVAALYLIFESNNSKVENWEECINQEGSVIQISYPRVCVTKRGEKFVEILEGEDDQLPIVPETDREEGNTKDPEPESGDSNVVKLGKGCVIGGCNSELCLEEGQEDEIYSICLYEPEYACLKHATCERQLDGKCGWTTTTEYSVCTEQFAQ